MKTLVVMACMVFATCMLGQNCVKNARGETICSNGKTAVAVNPHTGNATVAQKNQNGVTSTQTARGGHAKTKNGKGAVQGPNGTTCVKGQNQQGCKKL